MSIAIPPLTTGSLNLQNAQISVADIGEVVSQTINFEVDVIDLNVDTVIKKGDELFLHTSYNSPSSGNNLFLGLPSGNETLVSSGPSYEASNNVGLGSNTLIELTTGYNNIAIGRAALRDDTTGAENIGIGYLCLRLLTTGGANVALGNNSLSSLTTGGGNVSIGRSALSSTNGDNNTVLGSNAGSSSTGDSNIFIGYSSGQNLTTGSSNIMIGNFATSGTVTSSNSLNIGNAIRGSISTPSLGINASDTTTPVSTWEVNGSSGFKVRNITSTPVVLSGTDNFISVTHTTTAPVALTLPSASSSYNSTDGVGRLYTIVDSGANAGANNITISRAGSDTIVTTVTGATSVTISSNGGTVRLIAINSTTWKQII